MRQTLLIRALCAMALVLPCALATPAQEPSDYERMVALFGKLREFRQALLSKRVMDYAPAAIEQRRAQVASWRRELDAISPRAWPVDRQVDYLLVRSQFDEQEFEFRLLRPWSRDPGLYVDMVRELPYTRLPLPAADLVPFREKLAAVPGVLAQGKANLTEGAAELARLALRNLEQHDGVGHEQGYRAVPPAGVLGWYEDLAQEAARRQPELLPDVKKAQAAVLDFHLWLKASLDRMKAPAGVGREHYDWYLQRVHLAPYDAAAVVAAGERELQRTTAALKLEQFRNRALPALQPAPSPEEYQERIAAADTLIRDFILQRKFLTIPAFADKSYDNNVPWIVRPGGRRNFWEEVQYRDPLPDKVHAGMPGHRFDLFLHEHDKRPVRGAIRNGGRIEGWGFYLEEAMMTAGLLEGRPRTRELFHIFAMARAVRNKAEVFMHTNTWSVAEAVRYMVDNVPFMDEDVARVDCEIYLRTPTYGQNYQMGKLQIEQLLAERAQQLGDRFDLGAFHDAFLAAGTIPVSLIRWELTGRDDEVRAFWGTP